jgi:hypothetical protein
VRSELTARDASPVTMRERAGVVAQAGSRHAR